MASENTNNHGDSESQDIRDKKVEETILLEDSRKKSFFPPKGIFNSVVTNCTLVIISWIVIWSYAGQETLPQGSLFGLLVIFYFSALGGKLMEFIKIPTVPRLPPLLGMLLAGFVIRNTPIVRDYVHVRSVWSSFLRNTALTIILVRAGLGLDAQALKKLKGVCLRLSMGPCITEACAAAVFSHLIMKFPWQWGFLLGFVLGAVSPAVVVPAMLLLQEHNYGIKKGIPTLLIAASSFDDILAITGFNTCLSITFSSGPVYKSIIQGVCEAVFGVLGGIIVGLFIRYFPSLDQTFCEWKRAFFILGTAIIAVIGSNRVGLHTAGGLAAVVLTFVAGMNWSKEKVKVQRIIAGTWDFFQPLLFGLVGAEVSVSNLESNIIGISVGTLSLSLLVRIIITFFMVSFTDFSFKERIFVALSWIPKATVQAVLGPLALEESRRKHYTHLEGYSKDVMTIAFLSILITAPNGAILIGLLGPKALSLDDPGHKDESRGSNSSLN